MTCNHIVRAGIFVASLLWLVPARAAICYTGDGVLTNRLELQRWMINRARFAPEREADRLGLTNSFAYGHPDYDVCEDVNTNVFGGTTNDWAGWIRPRPPLAPNARLSTASSSHSKDMAESGFQHESPSSNYYPSNSSPYTRALIEGYTNQIIGYYENIGNGWSGSSSLPYPPEGYSPYNFHTNLFIDAGIDGRGHRQAILNAVGREIGLGFYKTNFFDGTNYWTSDYDTQDFGADSSNHFFTETVFNDANTNSVYDVGEGVGGIEIRLWDGPHQAAWYDVSGASGSFAIPINTLTDGHTIRLELTNTNATSRQITFPLGYTTLAAVTLTNQETFIAGYYAQPSGITNVGFRDLIVTTQCASVTVTGTNATVAFSSLGRVNYRLESNPILLSTNWTPVATGTATRRTCQLTAPATNSSLFYRVLLIRD